jgi:hypothetical protein
MITFGSFGQFFINLFMALTNRTQLELMEDYKTNIFDSGDLLYNFKATFGDPKWKILWLFPINTLDETQNGHDFHFYYEKE